MISISVLWIAFILILLLSFSSNRTHSKHLPSPPPPSPRKANSIQSFMQNYFQTQFTQVNYNTKSRASRSVLNFIQELLSFQNAPYSAEIGERDFEIDGTDEDGQASILDWADNEALPVQFLSSNVSLISNIETQTSAFDAIGVYSSTPFGPCKFPAFRYDVSFQKSGCEVFQISKMVYVYIQLFWSRSELCWAKDHRKPINWFFRWNWTVLWHSILMGCTEEGESLRRLSFPSQFSRNYENDGCEIFRFEPFVVSDS